MTRDSTNRSVFRRRLMVESLESRRVLTVLNVDTLSDLEDPAGLSLREAIAALQGDIDPDIDQINITLPGTIYLEQGELQPRSNLVIKGFTQPGVTQLLTTIDARGRSRILFPDVVSVGLDSLRLTGGKAPDFANLGGAIAMGAGALTMSKCWIDGNSAQQGGAIAVANTNLVVRDSTISNNDAFYGGGIWAGDNGSISLINSTISGNEGLAGGGGLMLGSGPTSITNCTITLDRTDSDGGGGIAVGTGPVTLNNTIVAGNVKGSDGGAGIDVNAAVSGNNNIIGNAAGKPLTDGVNGNLVGNSGAGVMDLATILDPRLRYTGSYTPFYTLAAGSPAVDGGSNALAKDDQDVALTLDQRSKARIVNGDALGTATVDIGAVEIAPPVLSIGSNVSFTENGPLLLLASAATISDADSTDLGGGLVVVSITRNGEEGDTLSVRHQGFGAGQIGVSARSIKYGGTIIGSFTGGADGPLVIRLNSAATVWATQALLRNIGYRYVGENPSPLTRTVAFGCEGGDGGVAFRRFKALTVIPTNDAPKLTGATTRDYTLNGPSIALTPSATVSDVDSANFSNGTLRVSIVSGDDAANRLFVGGSFTRTGDDLFLGSLKVATVTSSGWGLNDLVIRFTSSATTAIVQDLVRAVKFKTVSGTIKAQTLIDFTLTDGDGGTSNTIQVKVNVD